jgi:hypothetical protein
VITTSSGSGSRPAEQQTTNDQPRQRRQRLWSVVCGMWSETRSPGTSHWPWPLLGSGLWSLGPGPHCALGLWTELLLPLPRSAPPRPWPLGPPLMLAAGSSAGCTAVRAAGRLQVACCRLLLAAGCWLLAAGCWRLAVLSACALRLRAASGDERPVAPSRDVDAASGSFHLAPPWERHPPLIR